MHDLPARQLRLHRLARRPLLQLPQEVRHRLQLRRHDARTDVEAVDAEVGELLDELTARLAVVAERHAVEVGLAVDDVDPQRAPVLEVRLHQAVELGQLLRDLRVARRVHAREPAQAGQALQHRQRARLGREGVEGHRVASLLAARATRTSGRFQNR